MRLLKFNIYKMVPFLNTIRCRWMVFTHITIPSLFKKKGKVILRFDPSKINFDDPMIQKMLRTLNEKMVADVHFPAPPPTIKDFDQINAKEYAPFSWVLKLINGVKNLIHHNYGKAVN